MCTMHIQKYIFHNKGFIICCNETMNTLIGLQTDYYSLCITLSGAVLELQALCCSTDISEGEDGCASSRLCWKDRDTDTSEINGSWSLAVEWRRRHRCRGGERHGEASDRCTASFAWLQLKFCFCNCYCQCCGEQGGR